ncbi:MAG: hypothetical protein AAGJ79_07830 [Verrucomicrobiota bacterium]
MKYSQIFAGISILALATATALGAEENCEKVEERVAEAIKAEPEKTLLIVDEQVAKNESCACVIVKTAIEASEADNKAVAQIVKTAIYASTENAAVIAECGTAARPEAASEIKAALKEVFEGATSGKKPSKAPKVVVDSTPDHERKAGVVSAVYMIPPISGGSSGGLTEDQIRELAKELGISVSALRKILEPGGPDINDIVRRRTTVPVSRRLTTTPAPQSP